jgi:hypothetical protein
VNKPRIFCDTNVILEIFRIRCWKSIAHHFAIETVSKCVEECLTGNPCDSRHITVSPDDLNELLNAKHSVTPKEIAFLVLEHHSCRMLDDGEKHLYAWLKANNILPSDVILLSTADKAALVSAHDLGWLDCVTSLEAVARNAGVARTILDQLELQYCEDWLSKIRTKVRMGIIP